LFQNGQESLKGAAREDSAGEYALVDCEQDIVAGKFGRSQEFAVLLTFEAGLLRTMCVVAGKTMPEIDGQALIQQDSQLREWPPSR
jgi:hypothetical protein